MRKIKLEKITLNCGTGTDPGKLERSYKLLQLITGKKPVKTASKGRIPTFGIRPGLEIGCKITIRKGTVDLLKRFFAAVGNKIKKRQIGKGIFSFGVKEYIEIPGMQYNREIGILGFEVDATLRVAGKRVEERKIKTGKMPIRHRITKEETLEFIKENFKNVEILEK